ncbi:MAG TPA: protein kinase [Gemmatimonadaceae bacterium]|nr:protein kinase [Gemmatimonadaceae bacterium]
MTNETAAAIRPTICARCGAELPDGQASCPGCGLAPSAGTVALSAVSNGGGAAAAEPDMIAAALAGEYELQAELGRGGMATVYRARETALGRDVAIKILPLTHTFDREFVLRFQQEARTSARLEHPHIIPIYRVGTSREVSFFVMKYLRGGSLSSLLRERGGIPAAELRRLLREVGSALAHAAREGIVHRDIKPDNILLDEAGRFVVTDFGIARSGGTPRLTATGMSLGTPRYMSPEQARAKELDGRSDIYSLGVVAYECLVGRVPFDGDEAFAILYSHINAPVPRPALSTTEEWELYEIVERMLSKAPDDRVQDGEELVRLVHVLERRSAQRASGARNVTGRISLAATRAIPAIRARVPERVRRAVDHAAPVMLRAGTVAIVALRVARDAAVRLLARVAERAVPVAAHAWTRTRERVTAAVEAAVPAAQAGLRRVRATPTIAWATATPARAVGGVLAIAALALGGPYAAHAALHHRSACDAPVSTAGVPASATVRASAGSARAWSVLLDSPPARAGGGSMVIHYDVCGLDRGTPYTAELSVGRAGGAIRRLLGGAPPLSERHEERATGPATRRHRSIDLRTLDSGSYVVELVVTTADGRRLRQTRELRIAD